MVLTSNALSLIGSYQFTDTDSFGGDRVVQIQVSQVEDIPIVHHYNPAEVKARSPKKRG